jgi:hypothetical protein
VKQVSYSYALTPRDFPFVVPIEAATSILEVLLEEPAAQVTGGALRSTDAATTSGRTFKRFMGPDVPKGESVRVTVPVTTAATRGIILAVVAGIIALAMIAALARALMKRGGRPAAVPVAAPSERETLLASIAALDARRERGDATLSGEEYAAQRSALKARLAAVLAASDAPA